MSPTRDRSPARYHPAMIVSAESRARHHRWLTELTSLPTAAGREGRVVEWIERWVSERPGLSLTRDGSGNLVITRATPAWPGAPVFFTAHLDHPAFVVERVVGPGTIQCAFRGGVMEPYFDGARIAVHARGGGRAAGKIVGKPEGGGAPFTSYLAEIDGDHDGVMPGDVATWDLPPAEIKGGVLHAPACDDLAAVAAALAALDVLERGTGPGSPTASDRGWGPLPPGESPRRPTPDVRLLFTRAEEVGFIGAIAACRERTMPVGSRVLALENSRAFDESPVGGGPIVRVGDRMSVFSPALTGAVAAVAERIAGGPQPKATQKLSEAATWKWQRKLMPGGACEATVFCAAGYEATCLCLPLGNYHNMGDLAAVQAGTNTAPPRVAPEFISIADFDGLVDLLVECGRALPEAAPIVPKLEKLWAEASFVLEEPH